MVRIRKDKGKGTPAPIQDDAALKKDVSKILSGMDLNDLDGTSAKKNNDASKAKVERKGVSKLSLPSDRPRPTANSKIRFTSPPTHLGDEHRGHRTNVKGLSKARDASKARPTSGAELEAKGKPLVSASKPSNPPTSKNSNAKGQFKCNFAPTPLWHSALPVLPPSKTSIPTPTSAELASLLEKATKLHEEDVRLFHSTSGSSSSSAETSFLTKIVHSGTLSDRLSALTLLIQSSPVHNTSALESLRGIAEKSKGKGGREESLKAARCVVDWWVGGGTPARKLRYFRDQPLLHPSVTPSHLVVFYFEDWLKKYFFSVLQILETLLSSPLTYTRISALPLLSTLLASTPEQEHNVLRLLVHKLGDGTKSVASRASYLLLQVLQTHPAMKGVLVRECISALGGVGSVGSTLAGTSAMSGSNSKTSTKMNDHLVYYATVTLNQLVLTGSKEDRKVAGTLVGFYFGVFEGILGRSEGSSRIEGVDDAEDQDQAGEEGEGSKEMKVDKHGRVRASKDKGKVHTNAKNFLETDDESTNSKLVAALLTGVNRALPFVVKGGEGVDALSPHINTLFQITHTSTFNISLQALILIQQIVASIAKATSSPSDTMSASSKSESTLATLTSRYYRTLYASLLDTRLSNSSKKAMYLNLLLRSVKADVGASVDVLKANADDSANDHEMKNRRKKKGKSKANSNGDDKDAEEDTGEAGGVSGGLERIVAILRRFIQVLATGTACGGSTEFVVGGLVLLGELLTSTPGLRSALFGAKSPSEPSRSSPSAASRTYDPRKRDPSYATATSSCAWELTPLLSHYHPTISLLTRQLLHGEPLSASADLSQNTLGAFLERFVYRNAKARKVNKEAEGEGVDEELVGTKKARGVSAMQPAASGMEGVKLVRSGGLAPGAENLNEKTWLRKGRGDVPVDQMFFHDYFTRKYEREGKGKKTKDAEPEDSEGEEKDDDAEEGSDSEMEEDEIWKVMKATMPRVDEDDDLLNGSDSDVDEDDDDDIVFDDEDSALGSGSGCDDDEDESDDNKAGSDDEEGQIRQETDEGDHEEQDEDDTLSFVEASDNEDLISLDQELDVPVGLIEYDGSDADVSVDEGEEEEWGGIESEKSKPSTPGRAKRKRDEDMADEAEDGGGDASKKSQRKKKKVKLRSLPTFASYEDYAKLIEEGEEDNV